MERVASRADDLVFGSALNLLNYFNKLGGFTALLHLLRVGNERGPEQENTSKDADTKVVERELLPLDFVSELTGAFCNCAALFTEDFAASFVTEVETIVISRLRGMRDKELKELDKESLPLALQHLRVFLQLVRSDKEVSELVE